MRAVSANWESAILVCRKCEKRQKMPLAKMLTKALGGGRKRKAPVVKCLGVCPGHAVTMIDTRRPREWLLVKPGTPIKHVVDRLETDQA
jgi:NAD-dependent dihydropyrimidine dehydrogenase PreA subunit